MAIALQLYLSKKILFLPLKIKKCPNSTFRHFYITADMHSNYSEIAPAVIFVNIALASSLLLDLRRSSTIKSSRTAAMRRI
ncbi:hypothetical protein MCQ_00395 [Candidatus Bartonella washoeensis Sb944nv]|uniref:Uncharacterized protein n=1 Tax=Candidatus Bartonella washoeensis Sb944nv TaxID=1094563 RepID=J1JBC4_9HYPH|nr:hypothetical protein MCQ_00395 [Bartonella washoeensis Sb944nv]